jgi:hypothetical protein
VEIDRKRVLTNREEAPPEREKDRNDGEQGMLGR